MRLVLFLIFNFSYSRGNDALGDPLNRNDFILGNKLKRTNKQYWVLPFEEPLPLNSNLYQGDIVISKGGGHDSAHRNNENKWPKFRGKVIIPYTIQNGFTAHDRAVLAVAMEEFRTKTCVEFVGKTNSDNDYVHITYEGSGGSCSSEVGRIGGRQKLLFDLACLRRGSQNPGVAIHELMHTVGFWHEQSRLDRNDYIVVLEENIKKYRLDQFKTRKPQEIDDLGLPYDICSIMHYDETSFAKNDSIPTFIPKTANACSHPIGHGPGRAHELSEGDVRKINTLYKCEGFDSSPVNTTAGTWNSWSHWSQCSSSCGLGSITRSRSCLSRRNCVGKYTETKTCFDQACRIVEKNNQTQAVWSQWGFWSSCSQSCGLGQRTRTRACFNGTDCNGQTFQVDSCELTSCGHSQSEWLEWSKWSLCTVSCGSGTRKRRRVCSSGDACQGDDREVEVCNVDNCPRESSWGEWSKWSLCTLSCGSGTRARRRVCSFGDTCRGNDQGVEVCNVERCLEERGWGEWSDWSACSQTCGTNSFTSRYRYCSDRNFPCKGHGLETDYCNVPRCLHRPHPIFPDYLLNPFPGEHDIDYLDQHLSHLKQLFDHHHFHYDDYNLFSDYTDDNDKQFTIGR